MPNILYERCCFCYTCTVSDFHCNNLASLRVMRICHARCCLLMNYLRTGEWNPTGGPTNIKNFGQRDFFCCKWSDGMYQRWKASFEFLLMCKDVLAVLAVFWTILCFISTLFQALSKRTAFQMQWSFPSKHRGPLQTSELEQILMHVQLFYFHAFH